MKEFLHFIVKINMMLEKQITFLLKKIKKYFIRCNHVISFSLKMNINFPNVNIQFFFSK